MKKYIFIHNHINKRPWMPSCTDRSLRTLYLARYSGILNLLVYSFVHTCGVSKEISSNAKFAKGLIFICFPEDVKASPSYLAVNIIRCYVRIFASQQAFSSSFISHNKQQSNTRLKSNHYWLVYQNNSLHWTLRTSEIN